MIPASRPDRFERLRIAFQPIVNARSGEIYGVEALARGHEALGFATVPELLDDAFAAGDLMALERQVRQKAIAQFASLPGFRHLKLFLNADTRYLDQDASDPAWLSRALSGAGVSGDAVIVEITERHLPQTDDALARAIQGLRGANMRVALDDFGSGLSGLRLCHELRPDIIKIDRYFLSGLDRDARRRVVVHSIMTLAHGLGILVVAEGVETDEELRACQELGADFVQGHHIARPSLDLSGLGGAGIAYDHVAMRGKVARRHQANPNAIAAQVVAVPAVNVKTHLLDVLTYFGRSATTTFLPIVDDLGEPLGIVRESDIKVFAYDTYGRDILRNKAVSRPLRSLLSRCPIVDVNARIDLLVHAYTANEGNEGLLVVENRRYIGFLSSRALLSIVSDLNIAAARDQNPLTKLPGNHLISETLLSILAETEVGAVLAYMDFDNFKPFNDTYGFRQGDRALVLFAEILGKSVPSHDVFIGHVGGDDFFAAFRGYPPDIARDHLVSAIGRFKTDIESFYDPVSRAQGYLTAKDRDHQDRQFPLMRVSCAIADLKPGRAPISPDDLSALLARVKAEAKDSPDGLAQIEIGAPPQATGA